jgi:2-polyprenyl-6-methoxyphenol hydroxylase-like FAD-dependent oxidoreductase
VIVIGAGPAGLTTAVTLARLDVDVVVAERRTRPSELPRAVGISLRQMELLRSWGLEQAVRAGGDDVELVLLEAVTLADAATGIRHDINVPSRAQSAVISPTTSARVAQDHLEAVLADHLVSLPSAELRRGVEATVISQDERSVHVELRDLDTGCTERVSADYVVAADGAHSAVRSQLGVAMAGPEDVMAGVSVEFRAALWPLLGASRCALYTITHPDGRGVLIPAGQGDRWQFGVVLDGADDPAAIADHDALRRRITQAIGRGDVPIDLVRVQPFCSGAQVADRFSSGRVFLVGDAAHRVTPRGGNGLAMAVRDGIDLGWRLTWVELGWAPATFLSTYEAEARPVVIDTVARAADRDGSCHAVITEMQLDLGGRIPHAWLPPVAGGPAPMSTLDLIGPGLTLLVAGRVDAWTAAARALDHDVPVSVHELPPSVARAIGLHRPGGALLVRPDGIPVASWWAADDPRADLHRAITALLDEPRASRHEPPALRPTPSGIPARAHREAHP